nr:C-C chemokine receptor type 8-like [Misgurnus anguillicaudatus]
MNTSTLNFTTTETHFFGLMSILEMCAYSFSVLFGLPTQIYVIYLIVTGSRITSEFFNLNLAVCEIANSLDCFCYLLAFFYSSLSSLKMYLSGIGITGRPLFQCLICVERYLAVIHPVTFLKYKPLRYKVICCTAVWIICIVSCLFCGFIIASLGLEGHSYFFLVQFFLFISIQLFCCVAVLRALKQSGPGERGREKEEENHMKRRAFHLILLTTVNMVIMYAPLIINGFIAILAKNVLQPLWLLSTICFCLLGFVQPAFYLHGAGKLLCFFSK